MISYNLVFLLLLHYSLSFNQPSEPAPSPTLPACQQRSECAKAGTTNIIFKSTDGGQTWQDISAGLPENVQADDFVEKENELYVRVGNWIYHSKPNATLPLWEKETFPAVHNNLFKSTVSSQIWKHVNTGKMVESEGVLLATNQAGIIRSADGGETWEVVISEGGVGIAVERINGGFAAITYNTTSKTRRVRTSYDGGKTWQAIDADLPPSLSIASIVQAGDFFFCGHPVGIYRSADKGKTWKLIVPAIDDKVFNLSVSGKVLYAMPRNGGC